MRRCVYLFAREPSKWRVGDVEHVGRLVFSLTTKQINSIPLVGTQMHPPMQIIHFSALKLVDSSWQAWLIMTSMRSWNVPQAVLSKDTVEQVLVGQRRWEDGAVGGVCVARCMDRRLQGRQTQSLIRGIVKARNRRAKGATSWHPVKLDFISPNQCCPWMDYELWPVSIFQPHSRLDTVKLPVMV